jgi:hypothetical protein
MIDKQAPRLAYRRDEIVADGNVATRPHPFEARRRLRRCWSTVIHARDSLAPREGRTRHRSRCRRSVSPASHAGRDFADEVADLNTSTQSANVPQVSSKLHRSRPTGPTPMTHKPRSWSTEVNVRSRPACLSSRKRSERLRDRAHIFLYGRRAFAQTPEAMTNAIGCRSSQASAYLIGKAIQVVAKRANL